MLESKYIIHCIIIAWCAVQTIRGNALVEVVGDVGEGRELIYSSVASVGWILNDDSSECCYHCAKLHPSTRLVSWNNVVSGQCECFELKEGELPQTKDATKSQANPMAVKFTGVCGTSSDPIPWALKTSKKGCNEDTHDIKCCPEYTMGDNTAGKEVFIQEHEFTEDTCVEVCQKRYPLSATGVTESLSQHYGNGKNKCWCEFGEIVRNNDKNYKTCLFVNQDLDGYF